MAFNCARNLRGRQEVKFIIDKLSGQTIRVVFTLTVITFNWTEPDHGHGPVEFQGMDPPSFYNAVATATVPESLTSDDIRDAVTRAVSDCGYRISAGSCAVMAEQAWEEVREMFEANRFLTDTSGVVELDYEAVEEHHHLYPDHMEEHGMVPVADWSLALLEKREVDEDDDIECCICLQEVRGEATVMPCVHVFHGDCIARWLRVSHYCPLCRYHMPTHS